jgi:ATP-binding cassette subfamily B protein
VVSLFQQKFPSLTDVRTSNLSFYRVNPTSVQFINNEQQGSGQALGTDFHRSMVFNIFRELPRQEVASVAGQLDVMQAQPGEVIVRQGAPADKFFIIADGEVEVIREEGDQASTVAHLRQGQFFGEIAILRDLPRTATVKAARPTTLLAMDRDAFRRLMAQSLATTEDFDQVIQRRLDELAQIKAGA